MRRFSVVTVSCCSVGRAVCSYRTASGGRGWGLTGVVGAGRESWVEKEGTSERRPSALGSVRWCMLRLYSAEAKRLRRERTMRVVVLMRCMLKIEEASAGHDVQESTDCIVLFANAYTSLG